MKRSTERILTTHVGSLARPDALVPLLRSKDRGQPYDRETYDRLVREAVAEVVRKQTDAGVDVVTDGEQRRAFAIDVLACPQCGGRLRLIATIVDPAVIAAILAAVGLPRAGPAPAAPPAIAGGGRRAGPTP